MDDSISKTNYYLTTMSLSLGLVGSTITNISTLYTIKQLRKQLKEMEVQEAKENRRIYMPTPTEVQVYGKLLVIVVIIFASALALLSYPAYHGIVAVDDLKAEKIRSTELAREVESLKNEVKGLKNMTNPISGTVFDQFGKPMSGVEISVEGLARSVTTDDGKFHLVIPNGNGRVELRASKPGYKTLTRNLLVPMHGVVIIKLENEQ